MISLNVDKLRLIRKLNNYTQIEFANLLGVTQPTYARIESGYLKSWEKYLPKIIDILNIDVNEILIDSKFTEHKTIDLERIIIKIKEEKSI